VSPGGRKQVVFAGIEDNSSSSSSSAEDNDKQSGDSAPEEDGEEGDGRGVEEEEVWVKRPEANRPKEEDVPVTGVVVAKPSLCQNYPGATN
jgi:hypothetical protein